MGYWLPDPTGDHEVKGAPRNVISRKENYTHNTRKEDPGT